MDLDSDGAAISVVRDNSSFWRHVQNAIFPVSSAMSDEISVGAIGSRRSNCYGVRRQAPESDADSTKPFGTCMEAASPPRG